MPRGVKKPLPLIDGQAFVHTDKGLKPVYFDGKPLKIAK
jgi:hypothetical protein